MCTLLVLFVATFELIKKVFWLKKFFMELEVVPLTVSPIILFCGNNAVVTI